ncbi:hypothetical protein GCM10009828_035610 [Actinoplanes couchii]|uniref:Uncharacterized protein n=1 Tax=Actinoplanes couchii TaxID=403638 RepID=A0ABQ3X985_9ACTN|nr:hypothetical protein Aco03nite_034280 [Actinoplanes couchii]
MASASPPASNRPQGSDFGTSRGRTEAPNAYRSGGVNLRVKVTGSLCHRIADMPMALTLLQGQGHREVMTGHPRKVRSSGKPSAVLSSGRGKDDAVAKGGSGPGHHNPVRIVPASTAGGSAVCTTVLN